MTNKLHQYILNHCSITVTPEAEYLHPKDVFEDERDVHHVIKESEWNSWAWCCVCVTVTFHGITESDYMGTCSYKDQKEFEDDGDYAEMVDSCVTRLTERVTKLCQTVTSLNQ